MQRIQIHEKIVQFVKSKSKEWNQVHYGHNFKERSRNLKEKEDVDWLELIGSLTIGFWGRGRGRVMAVGIYGTQKL